MIYYKIIKNQYELYSEDGGKNYNDSSSDNFKPKTKGEKKYYKKYKNLIKSSALSINYYKNFVQLQIFNQTQINNYYQNIIGILKFQRDKLASGYVSIGNDIKNERDKISMLETMINGLEKFVQSGKDLEINVKKINLIGGAAMGYDQFKDNILDNMNTLSDHIINIDEDKKFLETKISDLHNRMSKIITQNDNLFKIKAEVEWIVNQMNNVEDDTSKVEPQDFNELYGKIKNMIDTAKTKGSINQPISEYIHKLEEYASYLENFIRTNNIAINSINTEKLQSMNKSVEQTKLDANDLLHLWRFKTPILMKIKNLFFIFF